MPRVPTIAILLLTLASTALAFDVTSYHLAIEPDFEARHVIIETRISILNPDLESSFAFYLNDTADVTAAEANGFEARFTRKDGIITVTTDPPARETNLTLRLLLPGGPNGDDPRDVLTDDSLYLLWSDRFYPKLFDDWASMTTSVLLPPEFDVVAPGRRTAVIDRGERREHRFETSGPIVSASVIAARGWTRHEACAGDVTIVTLLDAGSLRFREQIVRTSGDVIRFFSDAFGGYPFDQFAFVTIPGIYARRAFPGFIGYSPRYLAQEMGRTGHDAHETSLLWWGYTTRGSGPGSFQWTEGFGDYAEILYDFDRKLPIPQNFERFRSQFLARDPATEPPYTAVRGSMQDIVHGKYPWLMHLMRSGIGDQAFRAGMKLLFERYRHRTFTLEQFLATFEQTSGQSLAWWREEWLERPGAPHLGVSTSVRRIGAEWLTTVSIEPLGPVYHVPLEIQLDAGERSVRTVSLGGEPASVTFSSHEQPRRVVIDPEGKLLLRLRIDPPDAPLTVTSSDPFTFARKAANRTASSP